VPLTGHANYPTLAIAPKFSSILHFGYFAVAAMRKNKINFKHFKPLSKWITTIASVGFRALFGAATTISWRL
jgi:hypothetical protein